MSNIITTDFSVCGEYLLAHQWRGGRNVAPDHTFSEMRKAHRETGLFTARTASILVSVVGCRGLCPRSPGPRSKDGRAGGSVAVG